MKADEFYRQGQAIRSVVDSLIGKDVRNQPERPSQPSQPSNVPQRGSAQPRMTPFNPTPNNSGLDMGTPVNEPQPQPQPQRRPTVQSSVDSEYGYDMRIVDGMLRQYTEAGFDPRFAVGMVANAIAESNLVPSAVGDSGTAYGTFQWRFDRQENLRNYADRMGKAVDNINTHVDFSIEEMMTFEKAAYDKIVGADPKTAPEYARLIDKYYERSNGKARQKRADIAAQIYRQYYGEGGRAEGPMLSYSEEVVPLDSRVRSRQEIMRDYMTADGLMGERTNDPMATFAGEYDMGTREGTGTDIVPYAKVPYQTGETTSTQSPTGGQAPISPEQAAAAGEARRQQQTARSAPGGDLEVGTSREAAYSGDMRSGLGDIFGRREGESDASFRDRRRNIFLNAAEGFQMLSRGTDADFTTATQMRLDEKQRRVSNRFNDIEQVRQQGNADRNYELAVQQEGRLQRAQALEEQKFVMEQAALEAERTQDAQMQAGMAELYREQGYDDLARMAELGNATAANDLYTSRMEAKIDDDDELLKYRMSGPVAEAGAIRARSLGREELAAQIESFDESPKVAYEALQTLNDMDTEDGIAQGVDWANDPVYQGYLETMPQGLNPSQRQNYRALARSARLENDATTRNTMLERMVDIGAADSVDDLVTNARVEAVNSEYTDKILPGTALAEAGSDTMGLAANPDFNPNKLKGTIMQTFGSYVRSVPGGEELMEKLDFTTPDKFANTMLTAIKNGQLGNLSKGIAGQLSNREGQALLKRIGDGSNERAEIMALGQLLYQGYQKDIEANDARLQYLRDVQAGEATFSDRDMETAAQIARNNIDTFPIVDGGMEGLASMQRQVVANYMEQYQLDEPPSSFNELPDHLRGMVVRFVKPDGGEEYLPLFADRFREYEDDIKSYRRKERENQ